MPTPRPRPQRLAFSALAQAWALAIALAGGGAQAQALEGCRLKGIEREVRCGRVEVPENPDMPSGRRIQVHYAVVPAVAKIKAADPLFVFAGGPGQSAMTVAGQMLPVLSPINARRDLVFVDQRGTGRSAPLQCERPARVPTLAESLEASRMDGRLQECLKTVKADVAQYATWIAVRDIERVREAMGAPSINLWGASYGTRAALEYMRQFPRNVRSAVLDGVAPAAMGLPASSAIDADAALARVAENCQRQARCKAMHPTLASDIDGFLAAAGSGVRVNVVHPLTGRPETVSLDRNSLAAMLRAPLYVPQFAALLPHALARAAQGDHAALLTLSAVLGDGMDGQLAEVMHLAVICAEDMPRVTPALLAAAARTRLGTGLHDMYARACKSIPTRAVPAAFLEPPRSDAPVLILSGGADPVTPPRHGEVVARTLPNARHFVAPHLGHGVTGHGCAPDLVARFVRAGGFVDLKGKPIDGECLQKIPAPLFWQPVARPGTEAAR